MPEGTVRKKTVRRTAQKTTAKKTTKTSSVKRAPRKTSKPTETIAPAVAAVSSGRKAPTPLAANASSRKRRRLVFGASSIIFVAILGISVAIGYSDGGAIVVSEEIAKRIADAPESERAVIENITLAKPTNNEPLGGLVGTGKPAPAPVVPEEPTATSTEDGTTTEETTDESAEESSDSSATADEVVPDEAAGAAAETTSEGTAPAAESPAQ